MNALQMIFFNQNQPELLVMEIYASLNAGSPRMPLVTFTGPVDSNKNGKVSTPKMSPVGLN